MQHKRETDSASDCMLQRFRLYSPSRLYWFAGCGSVVWFPITELHEPQCIQSQSSLASGALSVPLNFSNITPAWLHSCAQSSWTVNLNTVTTPLTIPSSDIALPWWLQAVLSLWWPNSAQPCSCSLSCFCDFLQHTCTEPHRELAQFFRAMTSPFVHKPTSASPTCIIASMPVLDVALWFMRIRLSLSILTAMVLLLLSSPIPSSSSLETHHSFKSMCDCIYGLSFGQWPKLIRPIRNCAMVMVGGELQPARNLGCRLKTKENGCIETMEALLNEEDEIPQIMLLVQPNCDSCLVPT